MLEELSKLCKIIYLVSIKARIQFQATAESNSIADTLVHSGTLPSIYVLSLPFQWLDAVLSTTHLNTPPIAALNKVFVEL